MVHNVCRGSSSSDDEIRSLFPELPEADGAIRKCQPFCRRRLRMERVFIRNESIPCGEKIATITREYTPGNVHLVEHKHFWQTRREDAKRKTYVCSFVVCLFYTSSHINSLLK